MKSTSKLTISEMPPEGDNAQQETVIEIVTATYGPSEGRRLSSGELSASDEMARIPFSRDVAPFITKLLTRTQAGNAQQIDASEHHLIRIAGQKIPLMEGSQMNCYFGDPCPGTTKRLKIHYITYDSIQDAASDEPTTEVHHRAGFAEHERVVLRCQSQLHHDGPMLALAAADGPSSHMTTFASSSGGTRHDESTPNAQADCPAQLTAASAGRGVGGRWRLPSEISEICLPVVLPFLEVMERVDCRLVCNLWRHVIRDWGVAATIDINDDSYPNFTTPFLRGLLLHSHHSLQNLFLSGFRELKQNDLHPALPYLRKLKRLDISRCNNLDDNTLLLLSEHTHMTLQVLYLKGLRKVTNEGIMALATKCIELRVLEVSNLAITDECGICIGVNLTKLTALYMKDNYLLTNTSIDVITNTRAQLKQLTLWGCIRLRHLSFDGNNNLVMLNLWGCHSLSDDAAEALATMKNLQSLIVSECHKLTNVFLFGLSRAVPQLHHLHLRYCKKLTDDGISSIANAMYHLHSLDLSCCSRITGTAIVSLLATRKVSLTELRVENCSHLDVTRDLGRRHAEFAAGQGHDGRAILNALRVDNSKMSILDLRNCGGFQQDGYPLNDSFVQGMDSLGFQQCVPGFFQRPARSCNSQLLS